MKLIENSVDMDDAEMAEEMEEEIQAFRKEYRRINKDIKTL